MHREWQVHWHGFGFHVVTNLQETPTSPGWGARWVGASSSGPGLWVQSPVVRAYIRLNRWIHGRVEQIHVSLSLFFCPHSLKSQWIKFLKRKKKKLPWVKFWWGIKESCPHLPEKAVKILLPFPATYSSEFLLMGFLHYTWVQRTYCNRLNVGADMRIQLCSINPGSKETTKI